MNVLYLDCFSGISGDMTVGALMDLQVMSPEELRAELSKLGIDHEFEISIQKTQKNAISATDFDVKVPKVAQHHHKEHAGEEHHHHHAHGRTMADIEHLIENSTLAPAVKKRALSIFMPIAKAEAKVHNRPVSEVHFHEVGAVDSIVDIVAVAILMERLSVDKVVCSPLREGHGFIECQHGQMPVPVPAVSQMFSTREVPVCSVDVDTELVTPTGAGIVCALVDEFGEKPTFSSATVGYGSGKKELKAPNLLRVYYGSCTPAPERMQMVEANMDDMTGEDFGFLQEKLWEEGAADVFFTPIYMKKNRPATKLSVLCSAEVLPLICRRILSDSSTIGVRYYPVERQTLSRRVELLDTPYGKVRVKVSGEAGHEKVEPEYEDLHIIANNENIPLRKLRYMLQNMWYDSQKD